MTEVIQKTLRDSAALRWTALLLLALAMFCAYIFMDILSPIKDLMAQAYPVGRGWDSTAFGTMQGSETFLNVFVFFLIFAGIILDKMGVRFTAVLSGAVMLAGALIKYYAISTAFHGSGIEVWFTNHLNHIPVFEQLGVSPFFAKLGGHIDVSRSVAFGVVLLCIALIMFIVYFFMDKKLDSQTGEAEEKDDPFKVSDIGQILKSSGFWLVSLLCVLYYSAIFPFQKYAVNMLQCNLTFEPVPEGSFWASTSVTIIQYVIMLVVAATAFMFNFIKNKPAKYATMALSILFLVGYCYMGYMRQSAESIFAVFPLLAVGTPHICLHPALV